MTFLRLPVTGQKDALCDTSPRLPSIERRLAVSSIVASRTNLLNPTSREKLTALATSGCRLAILDDAAMMSVSGSTLTMYLLPRIIARRSGDPSAIKDNFAVPCSLSSGELKLIRDISSRMNQRSLKREPDERS